MYESATIFKALRYDGSNRASELGIVLFWVMLCSLIKVGLKFVSETFHLSCLWHSSTHGHVVFYWKTERKDIFIP